MSAEQFTNDAVTSLVGTITSGATSITVLNASAFPSVPQFRIRIDNEIMLVTAVAGATWTVTRAAEAVSGVQVASAHANGAQVTEVLTAASIANIPGYGTVTTVSIVSANGVSGSVTNPTTTPAITITLGAITPSSVAASGSVTGSNLSGTNTGDQNITLTGDVTGSGTGSFAATIGTNKVTYAKMQQATTHKLLGNSTGGTANIQEITIGTGLSFSGTTLNAGLSIGQSVGSASGNSLLGVSGAVLKQIGGYTAFGESVSFGTNAAGNGFAVLSDGSTVSAGYFFDNTSTYITLLGNYLFAAQFLDATNVVTMCNGTNALDVTGPAIFNGNLGFFAVAAVAQQTGGAAFAGGTYGATEQGMLNRAYAALRAYGLLS